METQTKKSIKELLPELHWGEDGYSKGEIIITTSGGGYQNCDRTVCRIGQSFQIEERKQIASYISKCVNERDELLGMLSAFITAFEDNECNDGLQKETIKRTRLLIEQAEQK